ncbi:alpha/beta hydrolase [Ottowia sp. GY511]|uniref:Alpha/beta hydrolase n=1 Tax=Ottowia flava TaxID=2675430 RepID=A0ABW4KSY1_9BURK|nr:lysophospholipase [Ottowia sp. GY511]TXK33106.1 alpha/beta hydrolase [Ottowia sp. GY511]
MSSRTLDSKYWRASWIRFREPVEQFAQAESLVLHAHDGVQVRGLAWVPKHHPKPRVAVIAAHQRVDFSRHYAFPALLRAGYLCVGANLRSLHNDTNCVHEQLLLDVAAYVNWLKNERGIEKVVWLGNSGGGSLGTFYQQQAKAAPADRLKLTPGGRPIPLADASMPAFDGMIISAAHTGQGNIINGTIDPSVVDEHEPFLTDASLDMYDPANGFQPAPEWSRYSAEFVACYQQAQRARVKRIDDIARAMIAERQSNEQLCRSDWFDRLSYAQQRSALQRANFTPVMVTHRTMANLHYVDNSIDPSDRAYGCLLSNRPDIMNYQLLGFARLQTPDAWLSTWSGISSNADLLKTAPAVTEPVIVIHAGRDLDVYPSHTQAILDALGSTDKTRHDFPNRLHYFEPGDEAEDPNAPVLEQMAAVLPWMAQRFAP